MIAQQQSQRQQLKILPQQIQLLNLFFLNSMELQQRIKNELEENPFLETKELISDEQTSKSEDTVRDFEDWDEHGFDDLPDYKSDYQNYFDSEVAPEKPIVSYTTFKDDLKQQLSMLDIESKDRIVAEYIIDILSPAGFMDLSPEAVADDLSFQLQTIVEPERVLSGLLIVQSLEPVGIGARSVRECLLMQLRAMNSKRPDVKCAVNLLDIHFNDLVHRQFDKLQHALRIDDDELRLVLSLIGNLKFSPVTEVSQGEPKDTIIPDFIVSEFGEHIQVSLYSSKSESVYVNQALHDQLASNTCNKDKAANQYIKSKLSSAQWFVSAVKQREDTMLAIMNCIVDFQREYFASGDIRLLKPMVLRNVAEKTGMDISTVSRVTSNKYADTHFGIIYLKNLFSEGIEDKSGLVISNKVIQSVIEEFIKTEDKRHPFTDLQLVKLLGDKGYNVARRTVAKYREQMHLPIAQIRAVWA